MILEKFDLEGRIAIVTGSGRGLGKAMSLALAKAGCDIVVTARTVDQIEQTAEEIRAVGRKALVVPMDVTVKSQVEAMIDQTIATFGKIDILINNAGGGGGAPNFFDITEEEWRMVMDTNLTGTFFGSQAAGKHMVARKQGKIINLSSGFGFRGSRNGVIYSSTKAAIVNFTRALALALAPDNIQVNAIAPGFFPTTEPQTDEARRNWARIAAHIPLQRTGSPTELGGLAVFLSSHASDYITGETFIADGGALAGGYAPTVALPS